MNRRIIEIADRGQYLSTHRGFMVVNKGKEERGRVPLADIEVLMLTSQGNSLSTNLIHALLEQNAMIVFSGPNFQPAGMVWPTAPHHLHTQRLQLQIGATVPLKKRLWQNLVRAKIGCQAEVLNFFGLSGADLISLTKQVGSGDPKNCEAQAARRYWPTLMGKEFRRDPRKASTHYSTTVIPYCAPQQHAPWQEADCTRLLAFIITINPIPFAWLTI